MNNTNMISVLVAVRNEAEFIAQTLDNIFNQDYPKSSLEVIVIDGDSEDDTVTIAQSYADKFEHFRIVSNARQLSAIGWNLGISIAKGNIISILSGHVELQKDHFSYLIKHLDENIAGVGGRAVPSGFNRRSVQISKAFKSKLGSGGATYINGKGTKIAETISFGCYWKKDLVEIGCFDENIVRGQDWDLNLRLRVADKKLLFVDGVSVKYYVRDSFSGLWRRQYLAGLWKRFINRKAQHHVLLRHIIPSVFAITLIALLFLSIVSIKFIFALASILLFYMIAILFESIRSKTKVWEFPAMFLVYFIIHFAYGIGFILGLGKR